MGNCSVVNKTKHVVKFQLLQVTALYTVQLKPHEEWGYNVGAVHFTVHAEIPMSNVEPFNQLGWYFKGENFLEIIQYRNKLVVRRRTKCGLFSLNMKFILIRVIYLECINLIRLMCIRAVRFIQKSLTHRDLSLEYY